MSRARHQGWAESVLVDGEVAYAPRLLNDRLLLGMKRTMSEMELSLSCQRSLEALRQKARRGKLFFSVAVGYVRGRRDRIAKDPDRRVQEAITRSFRKFAETQSMRLVHLWLRQEEIFRPAAVWDDEDRHIVWKLPVYNSIGALLTNPIHAGAHAFGRTESRKRILRAVLEEIAVTLADGQIEFLLHWRGSERPGAGRLPGSTSSPGGGVARGRPPRPRQEESAGRRLTGLTRPRGAGSYIVA